MSEKIFVPILGESITEATVAKWLKTKGDPSCIYEVWKKGKLHSRWHLNDKTKRWGRMSTPKKNIAVS